MPTVIRNALRTGGAILSPTYRASTPPYLAAGLAQLRAARLAQAAGTPQHRDVRLSYTGALLRTATFRGREHLVVPVVALKEGVLTASNAPGPELVLASEFSESVQAWGGRPVVMGHPSVDGVPLSSANLPDVLDRWQLGHVFNAHLRDASLLMDAYLDVQLAAQRGHDAVRVLERARAGQPIEVSVGVQLQVERKAGTHGGKQYTGIWRHIMPDHLAVLPEGAPGACSYAAGCGVRAAAAIDVPLVDVLRAAAGQAPYSDLRVAAGCAVEEPPDLVEVVRAAEESKRAQERARFARKRTRGTVPDASPARLADTGVVEPPDLIDIIRNERTR